MKSVARTELTFQHAPYSHNPGWSVKRKIRVSSVVLLLFALCEHLSSWMSFLYDRLTQSKVCKWEIESYFYYLATTHAHQVYRELPVNIWTVMWAEYMNVALTFIWSFNDLFIIIVSFRIASMFAKINNRLESYRGRVSAGDRPETWLCTDYLQISSGFFWDEIRCHYNEICELHEILDEKIGFIVCLACVNDLYSVCLQLLNVATQVEITFYAFSHCVDV